MNRIEGVASTVEQGMVGEEGIPVAGGRGLELRFLPEQSYPMSSHHKTEIEAHFPLRSAEGARQVRAELEGVQTVFVCFTNRVGSNLFTDLLDQAGFGVRVAEEDFNSSTVIAASTRRGFAAFDQYVAFMVRNTKLNGTFVAKIGPAQLLWLSNRGFIPDYFSDAKYIFVRRRDKIAQAVSLYIANATGRYKADDGPATEAAEILPFNKRMIADNLMHILSGERDLELFFQLHRVVPLEVWYTRNL